MRTEKDAAIAAKETAEQEIQSLHAETRKIKASSDETILSLQGELSTEKTEKVSIQQSYEGELQRVQSQLATARTEMASLKQSTAQQVQKLQGEISTMKTEKSSLQRSYEGEIQEVESQLATAMTDMDSLKESTAQEAQKLQDELSRVKAEQKSKKQTWKDKVQSLESELEEAINEIRSLRRSSNDEAESLRGEISGLKTERESRHREWDMTTQSLKDQLSTEKESLERYFLSQLSSVKSDGELLKQSLEAQIKSLKSQLSTAESEKSSLMQAHEKDSQSLQTQLLSSKSENESLRHSMEKEMQSLLDQLSKSILDNYDLGSESEDVLVEMEKLFGMTERYTGSTTEMVSMPQYMPRMTIVGKATELVEPNLAAARRLWISSRCGSLALDVAQAFFMQREISSAQFALLPWIHASLNRAVTTMCEKTLTPDLAISSVWILQGLVYTATVARKWSEGVWNPKIEEMLAQMTHWLGVHVSEASLLMMIVSQVNRMVTNESPSTSISPNDVSESRRIDSVNSDIVDGMAMVVDTSGIIILFTADNAFIFGATEVKMLELNMYGSMVITFDQAVIGLPATLMEIRLLNLDSPIEIFNKHQALLESVLPGDRCVIVYPFKKRRMR